MRFLLWYCLLFDVLFCSYNSFLIYLLFEHHISLRYIQSEIIQPTKIVASTGNHLPSTIATREDLSIHFPYRYVEGKDRGFGYG